MSHDFCPTSEFHSAENFSLESQDPFERLTEFCSKMNFHLLTEFHTFANGSFLLIKLLPGHGLGLSYQEGRFVPDVKEFSICASVVSAIILSNLGLYEITFPPSEEEIERDAFQTQLEGVAKKGLSAALALAARVSASRAESGNRSQEQFAKLLNLTPESNPSDILNAISSFQIPPAGSDGMSAE